MLVVGALVPVTSERALAQDAVADSTDAATAAEAATIAAEYGHPVTVVSDSNESTLVEAMPEGGMRATISNVPQQTIVDGHWKPIDSDLTLSAGWLVPKVSAVGVRFGGGGTNTVAQVRSESGDWITQSWPHGDLPVPVIDGDTAVYRQVFTDVDLRVTATAQGMREVFVVGNAEAAAKPELAGATFEMSGASVQNAPGTGTLIAVPESGKPVESGTPVWWDTSSSGADASGPGAGEQLAVPVTHTDSSVALNVDDIAADSSITYPLFVDPDWTPTMQMWWYTDRAEPTVTYKNASSLSVGYGIEDGIGYLSRAYYQFDISTFKGFAVSDAQLSVHQAWANSCDTTNLELWRTSPMAANPFSWNNQLNNWSQRLDAKPSTRGCGTGTNAAGFVGFTATAGVKQQLVEGQSLIQFGLRTANEANSLTRKHLDGTASLTVTYDRPPAVPTGMSMTSPVRTCQTDPAGAPAYVYNGTGGSLTFQARASDPDSGDLVKVGFYIAKKTDLSSNVIGAWGNGGVGQASNTWQTYTVGANGLADGVYAWKSRSADSWGLTSAYTPWCYFTVDSTAPGLPTVTSTGTSNVVGQPMTVTVTSSSSDPAAGFEVWWGTGTVTSPGATPAGTDYTSGAPACGSTLSTTTRIVCATKGAATLTVTPDDRLKTLWVASYDLAGNVSAELKTNPDGTKTLVKSSRGLAVLAGADDAAKAAGRVWTTADTGVAKIDDAPAATLPLFVGTLDSSVGTTSPGWEDATVAVDAAMVFPGSAVPSPFVNTQTAVPAVDTTKSFTVRGLVKPTSTKVGSIISQSGGTASGFELRSSGGGHWQFCMTPQGATGGSPACVTGSSPIAVGTYSMVSGVWDQVSGQLRLVVRSTVDNQLSTAQAFYSPPSDNKNATGRTVVGAAQLNGALADVFSGSVAGTSIEQGVMTAQELTSPSL